MLPESPEHPTCYETAAIIFHGSDISSLVETATVCHPFQHKDEHQKASTDA